ncbi:MAG: DoxX family protein [Parcubacteria group bacterium]|nr:DoxX family protein [Parcubacteria group bacterium]
MNISKIAFLKLRFVMSFIFLWAFIDKVFGLGFSTKSENAWIRGGSPTSGFLSFGTHGPLVPLFKSLSGVPAIDWLFMLGLLFVGVTLLVNRCVMWGAVAGIVMMLLMWLSLFPPANNPLIDEHIVYALVLAILALQSRRGELGLRTT